MNINTWDHGEVHAQAAAEGNAWVHNPTAARICVEVHTYFLLSLKVVWMLCLGCHLRVSWCPRDMLLPGTCQSEHWFLSSVFNESTFKNFYGYVYVTTCVYVHHMCAGVYTAKLQGSWFQEVVRCTWVLGKKPKVLSRAVRSLSCWVISSTPKLKFSGRKSNMTLTTSYLKIKSVSETLYQILEYQ